MTTKIDGLLLRLDRAHDVCTSSPEQVATMFSDARDTIKSLQDQLSQEFVTNHDEAAALPNRSLFVTPGGIAFRQQRNWFKEGDLVWERTGYDPIDTDRLCEESHFPGLVVYRGHDDERTPKFRSQQETKQKSS